MEKPEEVSGEETMASYVERVVANEETGEEFTIEYFRTKFLSSVGRSLYYTRRDAGLTQEQVAERMQTHQSAIARFEADRNGSMSFRRYADFVIACGMLPTSLMTHSILEPIPSLREKLLMEAVLQRVQERDNVKFHMDFVPEMVASQTIEQYYTHPIVSSTILPPSNLESKQAVESAERFVRRQYQHSVSQTQMPMEDTSNVTSVSQTSPATRLAINSQGAAA